ncbi:hypothetical protein POL58_10440 [Nannocystis sp. ncelm1]|uniref:Uncharacterized protein n=1 Tax=Nannocystis radixulma TaxID=2995305 RepID=A0ABT5B3N9_9BACT|nr:hypothetical protein [Nannocystis radixulma]MDC0668159.1 hypothetical protein [Nannocystis radixulma]
MPGDYRTFLTCMGHDTGGITTLHAGGFVVSHMHLSFAKVLKIEKKAKHRLPPRFTLVGELLEDPYECLCLDTEPSASEPHVARISISRSTAPKAGTDGFSRYEAAQSLAELVFAGAFVSFVFPRHRVEALMERAEPQADGPRAADKLLRRMEFTLHPASGGYSAFYTRSDAAALVYQNSRVPLHVRLRAQTVPVARQLVAMLKEHLGFVGSELRE